MSRDKGADRSRTGVTVLSTLFREKKPRQIKEDWALLRRQLNAGPLDTSQGPLGRVYRHFRDLEAERDRLREALRLTLQELDELGRAYAAARERERSSRISYVSWSRPVALDALGEGDLKEMER
jgi:hypothetical protein